MADTGDPAREVRPEELPSFLRAVAQLAKDLTDNVDEVVQAARELAEQYGDRVVGVWPLYGDYGGLALVEVVMDCNEEEWRRAVGVLLRHPKAAEALGVVCERALFHKKG